MLEIAVKIRLDGHGKVLLFRQLSKHTIKVCVSCSCGCIGTFAPCRTHMRAALILFSFESNVQGKVEFP